MKLQEVESEPERVPREPQGLVPAHLLYDLEKRSKGPECPSPAPRGRRGQTESVGGKFHEGTAVGDGEEETVALSCWKAISENLATHLNRV